MLDKRIPIKLVALGSGALALLTLLLLLALHLRMHEMESPSMEPLIHGRSGPTTTDGDCVLLWNWFKPDALRRGDLVAITFQVEGRPVRTIRRIQWIPGDVDPNSAAPDGLKNIPKNQFYVSALAPNSLDSRSFGLVPASRVTGKVIRIFHSRE